MGRAGVIHPGVARGRLVDVGLVDDEEDLVTGASVFVEPRTTPLCSLGHRLRTKGYETQKAKRSETHVLRSPQRNPGDTRNVLQAQLRNRFPRLLLVARVYLHR